MPVKGTRQFNLPEKLHFMCAFCCNESNCSVVNENKETSRLHDYLEAIYPNGYCLGQAHKLQVSHDQVQVKGNLEQFYESNPEAPVVIDTSPNLLGTTITIKQGDTLKKLIECLNEKLILEGQPEISLACMEVIEELFKFVLSD